MKKLIILVCLATLWVAPSVFAAGYYEFSTFAGSGSEYDVASYGNDVYYGAGSSVYMTTVSVADATKSNEPYYKADGVTLNANYQPRSFTAPTPINLTGYSGTLKGGSVGEMYVDDSFLYTLGYLSSAVAAGYMNQIVKFDKTTGNYVEAVVSIPASTSIYPGYFSLLSYGGGKWWASKENRQVYSLAPGDSDWTPEFTWPNMAGTHGDGMEFVNGYLFVSDMTSNFLAQWGQGDNPDTAAVESGWTEWNRFAYNELSTGNKYVEGMGFGALGHFWAGSGSYIYELGGGDIQQYVEPDDGTPPVPEPGTLFLLGAGLSGLALARRRKSA